MNHMSQTNPDQLPHESAESSQESSQESPQADSLPPTDAANEVIDSVSGDASDSTDLTEVEEPIDLGEAKRALEAVLLAAAEPMPLNELKRVFAGRLEVDTIRDLLEEVRAEWTDRSVELAVVASGYRFRVKPEYQKYLNNLSNEKPLKYSRAVLETLAIIAYRQPVTRGDIEDIRGVAVSPHILKTLEDRGWIDEIGHRETVGRPVLFATTKHFLDDLNLRSLEELPPLHELQATLDMSGMNALLGAPLPQTVPLDLSGVAQDERAAEEEGEGAQRESHSDSEPESAPEPNSEYPEPKP
jgi:segregation and condensation protein B